MGELEAQKKGLAIRFMRQRKNWTQADLSEKSSLSRSAINKIESGKVIPNVRTIIKICEALETTEAELITCSFQLGGTPKSPYETRLSEILTDLLLLVKEEKK
jgi:transcriptional regulator with XRE-family HTH domain